MPMYEYKCQKCGHRFEKIEKFSARLNKKCPKCKKNAVERLISSSAIQFKGSGWYVTDYGGKGGAPKEESKAAGTETASESVKTTDKPTATEEKPKEKKKEKKKD